MITGEVDYKELALQAADDLGYSENVKLRIQAATSESEISQIMCKARHATL